MLLDLGAEIAYLLAVALESCRCFTQAHVFESAIVVTLHKVELGIVQLDLEIFKVFYLAVVVTLLRSHCVDDALLVSDLPGVLIDFLLEPSERLFVSQLAIDDPTLSSVTETL